MPNAKKQYKKLEQIMITITIILIIIIIIIHSLLFMCQVNSYKANYRNSTVQINITT
jgi:heme/copper-type cytochrome/quinol oxidase subunit 2